MIFPKRRDHIGGMRAERCATPLAIGAGRDGAVGPRN